MICTWYLKIDNSRSRLSFPNLDIEANRLCNAKSKDVLRHNVPRLDGTLSLTARLAMLEIFSLTA